MANKYDKYYERKDFSCGLRSCDIILERPRSDFPFIGNWLRDRICDITDGIVSHAFIKGRQGDIIDITPSGVVVSTIAPKLDNKTGLLVFRNNVLTEEQKDTLLSYAYIVAQKKTGYDFAGLFSHLFPFIKQDKDLFYCSEFVSTCFQKIQVRVSNTPSKATTPEDLLDYQYLNGAFMGNTDWELADSQNMNMPAVLDFLSEKFKGVNT